MNKTFKNITTRAVSLIMAVILGLVAVIGTSTFEVHAETSTEEIMKVLFDPDFYAANNPDVVSVYGTHPDNLWAHYWLHGCQEGRAPSSVYDPSWYLSHNADLEARMGNDYHALALHYIMHGLPEGRQGSAGFSVNIYKSNYPDLQAAFGTDAQNHWKYARHFVQNGQKEGRNAVTDAPETAYLWVSLSNPSNRLNVRSSPSASASITGKIPHGSKAEVRSLLDSDWAEIVFQGKTAYVAKEYLSLVNPNASSSSSSEEEKIYQRLLAMADGSSDGGVFKAGTRYHGKFASEQCKGMAKAIYEQLFGYNIGRTEDNNYELCISTSKTILVSTLIDFSASDISNLFNKIKVLAGSFVQVRRLDGGPHSMIVLSSDANGATFLECNVDGRNGIQVATYSWENLSDANSALSVYTPVDYHLH